MKEILWHSKEKKDIFNALDSSLDGLTESEAKKRLEKYGYNELPKKKPDTFFKIFFNEIKSPLVIILLVTMVLSFIIGETTDAFFILIVVLLDATLGAVQEWKSNKNAEALQNLIKIEAVALRNKEKVTLNSANLVIGDIIYLESGDRVPADIRLIETHNLAIDESILTGESTASEKQHKKLTEKTQLNDRKNMAYFGTSVMRGRAIGIVVATGIKTEIGKITTEVLMKEDTPSTLSIKMKKFTDSLSLLIIVIAILMFLILYFKGFNFKEMFFSVIALAVSAIPEGLPVALTLSLSIASTRMAKKNVLVKKLKSVESLGSATVIASDKTGTLTLNEQTAKVILLPDSKRYSITGIGYNGDGKINKEKNADITDANEIIKLGVHNNEATLEFVHNEWISHGDGIDIAFLALGYKAGDNIEEIRNNNIGIIPYESEEKYSGAFYKEGKNIYFTAKGSLEKILDFSTKMLVNNKVKKLDKDLIIKQNEDLAAEGYRVIALAKGIKKDFKEKDKYTEKDIPELTFIGLVGFMDPVRKESKDAIKKCKEAGIKTVMITGDHPLTAFHIAKELKMISKLEEITTGLEIEEKLQEGYESFDSFIKMKKVFSRVTPLQKYEIVESYKRQGEFVAVTGDGVNDAPALKAANVGIAMGSGTDVAKETGSLIITDDNFSSIVSGIEEGRTAYNNVRKVTYMLLSCAVCEVFFYIAAIILNYDIPLLAVQLLWINLVTDGIQDAALSFELSEKDVMKRKPRNTKEGLFDKLLIKETLLAGLTMGILVMTLWIILIDKLEVNINYARTIIMLLMVFIQNFHTLNCRNELESTFKVPLKNNKLLILSIVAVLTLQLIVVENSFLSKILNTTTLDLNSILIALLFAFPILIVMEIFKYFERKKLKGE